MTPDSCLVLVFAALLGVAYWLWAAGKAPQTRLVLIAVALACFVATIVIRDIEDARDVASAEKHFVP
jgi:uncharacterized membrane protein YoaK (UPF0700 family)